MVEVITSGGVGSPVASLQKWMPPQVIRTPQMYGSPGCAFIVSLAVPGISIVSILMVTLEVIVYGAIDEVLAVLSLSEYKQ